MVSRKYQKIKKFYGSAFLWFFTLNETKLRGTETIELAGYEFFGHNRLKLKTTATCGSGGVAILIKDSLACKFNIICVDKLFEGILCLKFTHKLSLNEFLICTCYLPPEGSERGQDSDDFFNIGINHGFQCSNIRWITRKAFEHKAAGRVFKPLPSDPANV